MLCDSMRVYSHHFPELILNACSAGSRLLKPPECARLSLPDRGS